MASTFFQGPNGIQRFAPAWFLRKVGLAFVQSVGAVFDEQADRVMAGRLAANPYAAGARLADGRLIECDEDVLPFHSHDRGIRLYSTEPLLSKRIRLGQWRQLKKRRGTHRGELENLQPFWQATTSAVRPWLRIVFQNNQGTPKSEWHTFSPTGVYSIRQQNTSNWNYDDNATLRSRYWLIIHMPVGWWRCAKYGDGTVYGGGAIYGGLRAMALGDLVGADKEAKAAHTRLAGVIATSLQPTDPIPGVSGTHYPFDPSDTAQTSADGWTSLPTGNWGSILDPVTNLPTRPPWATWLFEDTGPVS